MTNTITYTTTEISLANTTWALQQRNPARHLLNSMTEVLMARGDESANLSYSRHGWSSAAGVA